jgi:hypothetical protein
LPIPSSKQSHLKQKLTSVTHLSLLDEARAMVHSLQSKKRVSSILAPKLVSFLLCIICVYLMHVIHRLAPPCPYCCNCPSSLLGYKLQEAGTLSILFTILPLEHGNMFLWEGNRERK